MLWLRQSEGGIILRGVSDPAGQRELVAINLVWQLLSGDLNVLRDYRPETPI